MQDSRGREELEEDEDSYIRDVASVWGRLDLVEAWLPHHRDNGDKITDYVLFPSAMYGQLSVLKSALSDGNIHRRSSANTYPGWSLMHFAVEGAQRTLPLATPDQQRQDLSSSSGDQTTLTPARSGKEVVSIQLDIIHILHRAGVRPGVVDDEGMSASHRACKQRETPFLEGSILLDILSVLNHSQDRPEEDASTPGLSSPRNPVWKQAMQNLVEWAYSRNLAEVLVFLQQEKYIDLTSPKLLITSNPGTLRECRNPLMIDTVHRGNYRMLSTILAIPNTHSNVLCKLYEYSHGQTHQKESVISYACHNYLEGRTHILTSIFSLGCDPKYLTRITLSGVNLRRVPFAILHRSLAVLDLRENDLDSYPTNGVDPYKLGWDCPNLQTLNFSKNLFTDIHPDIFRLPNLAKLVLSGNKIHHLPVEMWTAPLLNHLELNANMIFELPCPAPLSRYDLMGPFASVSVQPRADDHLQSWRRGFISHDVRTAADLHRSQVGFGLTFLDLSENRLADIPKGLPCLAPLLNTLRLSHNAITNLGTFSDYPAHLQSLDVSSNGLTRGIQTQPPATVPDVECLQAQLVEGGCTQCAHFQHQNLSDLKFLYLCQNTIEDLQIEDQRPDIETSQTGSSVGPPDGTPPPPEEQDPPGLLYPKLQALKISDNQLYRLPENIHRLTKLSELVVSGNERIRAVPAGLHRLTSLFTFRYKGIQFRYDGIEDPIMSKVTQLSAAEVLYHLKARELGCAANSSMRLFMIGNFSKGKSTLLRTLTGTTSQNNFYARTGRAITEERSSTVGIDCGKWVCSPSRRSVSSANPAATPIHFYTWDFAGQEEYYVTHQCFLTSTALYLLVWNVMDGEAGVEGLGVWLQNLQARAKGTPHTVLVVGTHLDQIPRAERDRKCQIWRDMLERYRIGRNTSRNFPKIVSIHFVGCPPPRNKGINIERLNNFIYDTAVEMVVPKSHDDLSFLTGFRIKVLEEMIPSSYDQLRQFVEQLPCRREPTQHPPVIKNSYFYNMVSNIIEGEEEVEKAVDYLHATTGVILHFNIPIIKDYYIINPQRWFDLCVLIISPNTVSSLVRSGRPGDERFGLLHSTKMNDEFLHHGCSEHTTKLVRSFLNQLGIIQQVNREYSLVPSAIDPDPVLHQQEIVGSFPRYQVYQSHNHGGQQSLGSSEFNAVGPLVATQSAGGILGIKKTGLIYRRMLILPPIASGFWSKLITLCLQKQDFQHIVLGGIPHEFCEWSLQPCGPAHRLRTMIGNLELSWMYWKTGIVLYVNETVLLELHSHQRHEFQGRREMSTSSVFTSSIKKAKNFVHETPDGWKFTPPHYKDTIEITVPEMLITIEGVHLSHTPPMSSKILVKALEMVDEVLKSQCEQFASSGIYSLREMMQVIPCPIEYGDRDERHHDLAPHRLGNLRTSLDSVLFQSDTYPPPPPPARARGGVSLPDDCLCVFSVDACIKETFTSDSILCPKCGPLPLEFLAPDLVFSDVTDFKIDKNQLNQSIDRDQASIAQGSFGIVFRRILHTKTDGDLDVAVKLFEQDSSLPFSMVEPVRSYSDMRYELNKLGSLQHSHVVKFIGVITNPHSFVLEWAPLMSLEKERARHHSAHTSMCPTSIFYILMQVTSALSYLHSPREVGIVHRDLKSNNILVFKFPRIGHACFAGGQGPGEDCHVLVKVTDMGISSNPLATQNKNNGGLRILVPEAIAGDDSCGLTEKVDIFTLGSCLYEMMTLRPLPPSDLGEPHYKQILLSGKRPQFYPEDPAYPPLLFQILEDCWQHEYYMRPSAEHLYSSISSLTHLTIAESQQASPSSSSSSSRHSVLLDSFTLHQEHRISVSHCCACDNGAGFVLCAAMSDDERCGRTIITAQYRPGDSQIQYNVVGTIRDTDIVSIQVTPSLDIFVACYDGTIRQYDSNKQEMSLSRNPECHGEHGDIRKVHYCSKSNLLVFAYENGKVHIRKCSIGNFSGNFTWRESCLSLSNDTGGGEELLREVEDVECLLLSDDSLDVFEIWLGINSDVVEVWSMPLSPGTAWAADTVSHIRTIAHVTVAHSPVKGEVRKVQKSLDESMMVTVFFADHKNSVEIGIVSVETKKCLRILDFKESVSSLLLTPKILALGIYHGGDVHLYETPALLQSQEGRPLVLQGHFERVYALHCLEGHIQTSGYTSVVPSFVGRAVEDVGRDFLVSVGFGRGYSSVSKRLFRKSNSIKGSFVNVWVI